MCNEDLIYRLRKRAEIRRNIQTRKSVQEGKPDRLADLLEEAADEIQDLRSDIKKLQSDIKKLHREIDDLQTMISYGIL